MATFYENFNDVGVLLLPNPNEDTGKYRQVHDNTTEGLHDILEEIKTVRKFTAAQDAVEAELGKFLDKEKPDSDTDDEALHNRGEIPCKICQSNEKENEQLLCDGCNSPFHYYCAGLDEMPPTTVDSPKWYCPDCTKAREKAAPEIGRSPDLNNSNFIIPHGTIEPQAVNTVCEELKPGEIKHLSSVDDGGIRRAVVYLQSAKHGNSWVYLTVFFGEGRSDGISRYGKFLPYHNRYGKSQSAIAPIGEKGYVTWNKRPYVGIITEINPHEKDGLTYRVNFKDGTYMICSAEHFIKPVQGITALHAHQISSDYKILNEIRLVCAAREKKFTC